MTTTAIPGEKNSTVDECLAQPKPRATFRGRNMNAFFFNLEVQSSTAQAPRSGRIAGLVELAFAVDLVNHLQTNLLDLSRSSQKRTLHPGSRSRSLTTQINSLLTLLHYALVSSWLFRHAYPYLQLHDVAACWRSYQPLPVGKEENGKPAQKRRRKRQERFNKKIGWLIWGHRFLEKRGAFAVFPQNITRGGGRRQMPALYALGITVRLT